MYSNTVVLYVVVCVLLFDLISNIMWYELVLECVVSINNDVLAQCSGYAQVLIDRVLSVVL